MFEGLFNSDLRKCLGRNTTLCQMTKEGRGRPVDGGGVGTHLQFKREIWPLKDPIIFSSLKTLVLLSLGNEFVEHFARLKLVSCTSW